MDKILSALGYKRKKGTRLGIQDVNTDLQNMSRKQRTIQVYDSKKYLTGNGFLEELRKHLSSENCGLVVRESYSEVDKSDPVLVLCHLWSRVGTDFDCATLELERDFPLAPVAVIVVHVKDEHALSSTRTVDMLLEEKYDQFGLIVDLAYTPSKTMYTCKMNETGYQLLREFIQKHAKQDVVVQEEKKSEVQIFCQYGSEVADTLYADLKELVKKDKDINTTFHKLPSMFDRDWSTGLLAIFEDDPPVLQEVLISEKMTKHQTMLLILRDSDTDRGEAFKFYLNKTMPVQQIYDDYVKTGLLSFHKTFT